MTSFRPNVPRIPPMVGNAGPTETRRNFLPVIGDGQLRDHGEQAAWLLTRGSTLVCMGPEATAMTAGNNYDYHYKCLPHPQNTKRLWSVSLAADDDGASGKIKSLDGATTYATWTCPAIGVDMPAHTVRIVTFVVDNADDSVDGNGHSEFGIRIAMDSGTPGEAFVTSIQCSELPVPFVLPGDYPDASYVYPNVDSLRTGQLIYDDEDDPSTTSMPSVALATRAAETDARRAVLFCCYQLTGIVVTGGSYEDVYEAPVPVLARKRYDGEAAAGRTIKVWCYAKGVGDVKVTAASGDTATMSYNSAGAFVWNVASLDIDAENMGSLASDGGLQSSTRDTVHVEAKCTSGSITVQCVMGGEVD